MKPSEQHLLTTIAREELGIETLETRHSYSLDFHDLSIWIIKRALLRAYRSGQDGVA